MFYQWCTTLFSSIATGSTQAVSLEVKDGNTTCIKAELLASFSITYNTTSSTVRYLLLLGSECQQCLVDIGAVSPMSAEHGGRGTARLCRCQSWRKLLWNEWKPVVAHGSVWIRPRAAALLRFQRQCVQPDKPVAAVQPQRLVTLPRGQQLWWDQKDLFSTATCLHI